MARAKERWYTDPRKNKERGREMGKTCECECVCERERNRGRKREREGEIVQT